MKRKLLVFVILLFVLALSAQDQYSRVKIYANHEQLQSLAAQGVIIENGIFKADVYVICELSQADIAKVEATGLRYDVMIPDVSAFYEERNRPYLSHLDDLTRMTYDLSDEWPVPEGFELGACGGFFTVDQAMEHLDSMVARYPDLISPRHALPYTTANGRQLYWVRLSDNPNTDEDGEPEVLYTGMHHAREPVGMQLLLYYMYYLLENYDTDPDVQYIVNNFELYFIPIVNPDGYAYNIQNNPNGGGMWRKNRRQNDDGSYGVDPNRNYGYMWAYDDYGSSPDPESEVYRGTSAFSEPETKCIRDFCEEHNFRLTLNYHSYGNQLLYPWGYISEPCPSEEIFHSLGQMLTYENAYEYGAGTAIGYPTNGGSDDWMYGEQDTKNTIYAFTPEVGDGTAGFWPPVSQIIPLCQYNMYQNMMLARLAGPWATLSDRSPTILSNKSGLLFFELKRQGLQDSAIYTVSVEPLSNSVIYISNPLSYSNIGINESVNGAFVYTLRDDIQEGDSVRLLLSVNDGLGTISDTINKFYGTPVIIFSDSANTMENWTSEKWDTTSAQYHSYGTAITDSPDGQYGNYENNTLTQNVPVDLTGASVAILNFWARWDIETGKDYTQILISVDEDTSWTPLQGRYTRPGTLSQDPGQPVYHGVQDDWIKEEISLDPYLNHDIRLRFVLKSNYFVVADGFYWDDMTITTLQLATGIGENLNNSMPDIILYPNPAGKIVNVDYQPDSLFSGKKTLKFLSISGQKISEHVMNGIKGHLDIDVTSWPAGMYFYSVDSEQQGIISSGKLIVR